jgi:AraC family transcriptional regulator
MNAIWDSWLPQSGYEAADAPGLERYDERFNPETGLKIPLAMRLGALVRG